MGLFNLNNKEQKAKEDEDDALNGVHHETDSPEAIEIPKMGIYKLYDFINTSHEQNGFNDALAHADASYMNEYLAMLEEKLRNLLREVSTYYRDKLTQIDLHVETRGRAGLMDIVDELKSERQRIEDHMLELEAIRQEYASNSDRSHGVFLSYKRGFMRGMAAITHHQLLNNKNGRS